MHSDTQEYSILAPEPEGGQYYMMNSDVCISIHLTNMPCRYCSPTKTKWARMSSLHWTSGAEDRVGAEFKPRQSVLKYTYIYIPSKHIHQPECPIGTVTRSRPKQQATRSTFPYWLTTPCRGKSLRAGLRQSTSSRRNQRSQRWRRPNGMRTAI